MSPEPREPGKSATLPLPEINPLHHPLLRQNLERWAEVYFANPPEKRDDAVLQLLRELERRESSRNRLRGNAATQGPRSRSAGKPEPLICEACGYVTRPNQRFCGRCGARLITPFADALEQGQRERAPTTESGLMPSERGRIFSVSPPTETYEGADATDATSDEGTWEISKESPSIGQSYRLYVGILFAILIGCLGYLAGRSGQNAPNGTSLPPQAATAATSNAPTRQAADQPTQKRPNTPPQETSASPPSGPAQPAKSTNTSTTSADANSAQSTVAPTAADTDQAAATPELGNGSDEFENAKKLLNAPTGYRDSAQAAGLLWKSVSKKNTGAMVTLAELYLKGDGVQKNCDQGRVLLDAAAKKGSKEASQLLRNLPGFGCE